MPSTGDPCMDSHRKSIGKYQPQMCKSSNFSQVENPPAIDDRIMLSQIARSMTTHPQTWLNMQACGFFVNHPLLFQKAHTDTCTGIL